MGLNGNKWVWWHVDLFPHHVSYYLFFRVQKQLLYTFCPNFMAVLSGRGRVEGASYSIWTRTRTRGEYCYNGLGEKQDMGKESQFYRGKKVKCSKNNSVTLFFLVNPYILENKITLQTFQKLSNVLLYFPSSSRRKYSHAWVCVHVCAHMSTDMYIHASERERDGW